MKTILITGCSSGFGLETARHCFERGFRVIATMRTPREDVVPRSERARVLALDVTDPESIRQAVEAAGPIDALVNNAGVGIMSVLEGTSLEAEAAVLEVFVTCSWADPRDPKGGTWAGTGLPSLKGTHGQMTRPVTAPDDVVADTCKRNQASCETLVFPSRYSNDPRSADLRVVRPTPDGGRAEITVAFRMP